MALAVTIRDDATPLLQRLGAAGRSAGLRVAVGRSVQQLVRDHLFALNTQRHRFGRGYYAQAARATQSKATPTGAVVSINQVGIAQRRFGGVIVPRKAKFLTIPADPAAYGKRAREFNDLKLARLPNPRTGRLQWALVRRASTAVSFRRRRTKGGGTNVVAFKGDTLGGEVMYWLARRVEQKPDPSVLPTDRLIAQTALETIRARLARLARREEGTA